MTKDAKTIEVEVHIHDELYAEARKAVNEGVSDKELIELALKEFIRCQKEKRGICEQEKS